MAAIAAPALAGPKIEENMTAADAEPFCSNQAIWKRYPQVKKEECIRVSLECYSYVMQSDQTEYKGLKGHSECIFNRLGISLK